MTFKIGGLSYPDVGTNMLKDKTLGPILRSVMRVNMQQENYMFLDAVAKGESYSNLYNGFIDGKKAKRMINIGSATRRPMDQAGAMGNFYDKKLWKKGIEQAVADIETLVQNNITEKELMANKAFRAHHHGRIWYNRKNFYKQWKKQKEMKKVEKFLGATDKVMKTKDLYDAYAALKYNPKASKKPLQAVATAIGKTPAEVKSAFNKLCNLR